MITSKKETFPEAQGANISLGGNAAQPRDPGRTWKIPLIGTSQHIWATQSREMSYSTQQPSPQAAPHSQKSPRPSSAYSLGKRKRGMWRKEKNKKKRKEMRTTKRKDRNEKRKQRRSELRHRRTRGSTHGGSDTVPFSD